MRKFANAAVVAVVLSLGAAGTAGAQVYGTRGATIPGGGVAMQGYYSPYPGALYSPFAGGTAYGSGNSPFAGGTAFGGYNSAGGFNRGFYPSTGYGNFGYRSAYGYGYGNGMNYPHYGYRHW